MKNRKIIIKNREGIVIFDDMTDNLEGADLEYADLENANLKNANLDNTFLKNANLKNANLDYQIQEGLLSKIAEIVLNDNNSLEMSHWHTCDTVHCLAGWACYLNQVAKKLEEKIGPANAGLLTLGAEAYSYFYKTSDKEEVIDFLKRK
jgi:hypothetical protein